MIELLNYLKLLLYQEVSGDLGTLFYVSMILIGTCLLLYLCNCVYKLHKYQVNYGLLTTERLQTVYMLNWILHNYNVST